MKLRIVERYTNDFSSYYIVQKYSFWNGWTNLWPDYYWSDDGWTSWDRSFTTEKEAMHAIKEWQHANMPDKVVRNLEIS